MVNYLYVNSTAALVGIIFIVILYFNTSTHNDTYKSASGYQYAKHNGSVISIPKHILHNIINEHKRKLTKYSSKLNENTEISPELTKKINVAERLLKSHIYNKYGVHISPQSYELEKYVLDCNLNKNTETTQLYNRGSTYDEEIIGESELINHGKSVSAHIGKIIWYLEQIILLDNSSKSSNLELPLQLDYIKDICEVKINDSIWFQDMPYTQDKDADIELTADYEKDLITAGNFPGLFKRKCMPKNCSSILRDNNYFSDAAGQDQSDPLNVSDEGNQKAKNMSEAQLMWKNNIMRSSEVSHARENDFTDSINRETMKIYVPNTTQLAFDIAQMNKINLSQKNSLTDKWDYLEQQFLSN